MLHLDIKTAQEARQGIADRFKRRRLAVNLTQRDLAARSGVSWSSLKRFEREGLIALDSLLNLAMALDCLGDFDKLAAEDRQPSGQSLDALLAIAQPRRRATSRKGHIHGL
jgi:transcriptional regulator with XRE-family HTH domain